MKKRTKSSENIWRLHSSIQVFTTTVFYEGGSGVTLYDNGTIYYESNGSEVFAD